MKKKAVLLGIAGSMIGLVSCLRERQKECDDLVSQPISIAGRVIKIDSANDRVIIDTSMIAITRDVRTKPEIQINGLFSKNIRPKKGDILFFKIDSVSLYDEEKRIESCVLFPYRLR